MNYGSSVLGFKAVLCYVLIFSVWLAIRTRNIIHEHATSFSNKDIAQPGMMLVLFGVACLQLEINEMISAEILRRK